MKKVLIGCGIVAAVITVIGIATSIFMIQTLKDNMPDTERSEKFQEQLLAAHPHPNDYVPLIDPGEFPAAVRAYLKARAAMADAYASSANSMDDLGQRFESDEFQEGSAWTKFKTVIGTVESGMDLASNMVNYVAIRDSVLLAQDVGLGDFTWWNGLTLFAWQEWDPVAADLGDDDVEDLARELTDSAKSIFRRQLRNQRSALRALESPTDWQSNWLETLEASLAGTGFPLQGQLDAAYLAALEPHAAELRALRPQTSGEMMTEAANFQRIEFRGSGVTVTDY